MNRSWNVGVVFLMGALAGCASGDPQTASKESSSNIAPSTTDGPPPELSIGPKQLREAFARSGGRSAATAAMIAGYSAKFGAPSHSASLVGNSGVASRLAESTSTHRRVDDLRARFVLPTAQAMALGPRAKSPKAAVLGTSVASGFEVREGYLRPLISAEVKRRVTRAASVALPTHAHDPVRLEDDGSHLVLAFSLRGASEVAVTSADGIAMYPGALAGADIVHRVHAEGTEDYVAFETRPAKEELAYDVDVSHVAGLRLVSNTLEFLDSGGAPRLRVARPYVVDATGVRTEGSLALEGCAYDANPAAPWGRAVTASGQRHCVVRVTWKAATYPALVDPNWSATGSMATARMYHTATLLNSGAVLIAGGQDNNALLSTAELYQSGTFAATGSLALARELHVAVRLVAGKVLIVGGSAYGACELYDPTAGTFAPRGAMAAERMYHSATLLPSGQVLVAGGRNQGGYLSSAELYDPAGAGTFSATSSMAVARERHTATLLSSGMVLVAGGWNASGGVLRGELYDPSGGTFTGAGSMPAGSQPTTATLLQTGKVLLVGGGPSSATVYDPAAGFPGGFTFGPTGSMAAARQLPTATLLGSGQVLLAGGYNGNNGTFPVVAELYDPTGSGTFATSSSMAQGRVYHTATLLGSGKVLVAGGYVDAGALASAELYDECTATNTCSVAVAGTCGGDLSFTSSPPSPQLPGTAVTFVATPTCDPGVTPEFQFWLGGSTGYHIVQDYSTSASFAWDTTGIAEESYTVLVRTRAQGSATGDWGNQTSSQYIVSNDLGSCPGVVESVAPESSRPAGTLVTFTATGACTPNTAAEYQFYLFNPNVNAGTWTVAQDFSTSATFAWDTAGMAPGTYLILTRIRRAGLGSGYETQDTLGFTLTASTSGVCNTVTETFSPSSPNTPGTTVTFNANAVCTDTAVPEYQFWLYNPNSGAWGVRQDWSDASTFVWDSNGLADGNYAAMVRARRRGDLAGYSYESQDTVSYLLATTPPPAPTCTELSATTNATEGIASTLFTVTAVANCGNPSYQFWVNDATTGAWSIAQDWSASDSLTWNSTGKSAGRYAIMGRVRPSTSLGNFESQDTVQIQVQ